MGNGRSRRRALAKRVAVALAEELFVNGAGQHADRLVLTGTDGRDLGGLCNAVVIDRATDAIYAALRDDLDAPGVTFRPKDADMDPKARR